MQREGNANLSLCSFLSVIIDDEALADNFVSRKSFHAHLRKLFTTPEAKILSPCERHHDGN